MLVLCYKSLWYILTVLELKGTFSTTVNLRGAGRRDVTDDVSFTGGGSLVQLLRYTFVRWSTV